MSWNGSGTKSPAAQPAQMPTAAKKSPAVVRGIIAGVVIAVGVFVVVLFMLSSKSSGLAKDGHEKIKKSRSLEVVQTPRPAHAEAKKQPNPLKSDRGQANADQSVQADGTNKTDAARADDKGKSPKPTFANSCDDLIAKILTGEGGNIPPLPHIGREYDKQVREALKRPIEIGEGDSEEVKALKERVIEARRDVLALMDNGESFSDILNEHRDLLAENTKIRDDSQRELRRLVEEGDIEGAKRYYFKINIALQQMGIKDMDKPRALWSEEETTAYREKLYDQRFGEGRKRRLEQGQPHFK